MANFAKGIISKLITYLIVFLLFSFGAICFVSKEFPPKLATIKSYVHDLTSVSDNYKNLLHRSEKAIQRNLPADNLDPSDSLDQSSESKSSTSYVTPASISSDELSKLSSRLSHIESQLEKIERQNHFLIQHLQK